MQSKNGSLFSICLSIFLTAAVIVLLPGIPGISHADGSIDKWIGGSLTLPSHLVLSQPLPRFEDAAVSTDAATASIEKPKGFDMSSAHKYLGYTTLAFAAGAAFSSSNEDIHEPLGYAAAGMATLTCITGYLEYSDYFNMDDGWSKTNIHIVSGATATAGFIVTAILGAGGDGHGGIGGVSTALMVVPIVILKW